MEHANMRHGTYQHATWNISLRMECGAVLKNMMICCNPEVACIASCSSGIKISRVAPVIELNPWLKWRLAVTSVKGSADVLLLCFSTYAALRNGSCRYKSWSLAVDAITTTVVTIEMNLLVQKKYEYPNHNRCWERTGGNLALLRIGLAAIPIPYSALMSSSVKMSDKFKQKN